MNLAAETVVRHVDGVAVALDAREAAQREGHGDVVVGVGDVEGVVGVVDEGGAVEEVYGAGLGDAGVRVPPKPNTCPSASPAYCSC